MYVLFWTETGEALGVWPGANFVPHEGDRVRVNGSWFEVLKVYWHDHNQVGCNCRKAEVEPIGAAGA